MLWRFKSRHEGRSRDRKCFETEKAYLSRTDSLTTKKAANSPAVRGNDLPDGKSFPVAELPDANYVHLPFTYKY
jgi:hypothetical protein